jgi:hypothetical protein
VIDDIQKSSLRVGKIECLWIKSEATIHRVGERVELPTEETFHDNDNIFLGWATQTYDTTLTMTGAEDPVISAASFFPEDPGPLQVPAIPGQLQQPSYVPSTRSIMPGMPTTRTSLTPTNPVASSTAPNIPVKNAQAQFANAFVYDLGMDPKRLSLVLSYRPAAYLGPKIDPEKWTGTSRSIAEGFLRDYHMLTIEVEPVELDNPLAICITQWKQSLENGFPTPPTVLYTGPKHDPPDYEEVMQVNQEFPPDYVEPLQVDLEFLPDYEEAMQVEPRSPPPPPPPPQHFPLRYTAGHPRFDPSRDQQQRFNGGNP